MSDLHLFWITLGLLDHLILAKKQQHPHDLGDARDTPFLDIFGSFW
jgi:hypothetical protein